MILCGVVWGLWIGFAIVCAGTSSPPCPDTFLILLFLTRKKGTLLGEIANFFAFKYTFRGRAAKLERKNMNYALLAHVVREGGLKIAVICRLSAIPG